MFTGHGYKLVIDGWRPALANELMRHPMKAGRLKKRDAGVILKAATDGKVPAATGPRSLRILIEGRFHRHPDPDAPLKSLLDGLKRAELIVDDSATQCRWEKPEYRYRREGYRTTLEIEDVQ